MFSELVDQLIFQYKTELSDPPKDFCDDYGVDLEYSENNSVLRIYNIERFSDLGRVKIKETVRTLIILYSNFISLEGCPIFIENIHVIGSKYLTSLKGIPSDLKFLNCSYNINLASFDHCPTKLKEIVYYGCDLLLDKEYPINYENTCWSFLTEKTEAPPKREKRRALFSYSPLYKETPINYENTCWSFLTEKTEAPPKREEQRALFSQGIMQKVY